MLYNIDGVPPIDTSRVSIAGYLAWCISTARRLLLIDREQLVMWYQGDCTDADMLASIVTHGEARHAVRCGGESLDDRQRGIQVLVACVNNLRCGLNETGKLVIS